MLPLTGKTLLVTRSAEQSSHFSTLLQQQGAKVIEMPTLEIRPPSSWEKLDRAIADLADFSWLILTSANGVEYFFERLTKMDKSAKLSLENLKIAVVGKKTAAVLKEHGVEPDFIPPEFVADSLVKTFPETLTRRKILFPRVETGGREVLVKELTAQGAEVVEVPAYESGCPDKIVPDAWDALQKAQVDIVTFASSKTVQNFYQLIEKALENNRQLTPKSLLEKVSIASIGPQTSKSCVQLLGKVDVEAKEYTLEGLTEAIINHLSNS